MPLTQELTLDLTQSIEIDAKIEDAYQSLIRRSTADNSTPDKRPMVLED